MKYFETLFKEQPHTTELDAPVILEETAIIKDTVDKKIQMRNIFLNVGDDNIVAVAVKMAIYNVFGEIIDENDYVYQDMVVVPGEEFGNKIAIDLPDNARKSTVTIEKTITQSGNVWTTNPDNIVEINEPKKLAKTSEEFIKRIDDNPIRPMYYYIKNSNSWQCTCGQVNKDSNSSCRNCGRDASFVSEEFSQEAIAHHFALFREKEREEKVVLEEERKGQEANRLAEKKENDFASDTTENTVQEKNPLKKEESENQKASIKKKRNIFIILSIAIVAIAIIVVTSFIVTTTRNRKISDQIEKIDTLSSVLGSTENNDGSISVSSAIGGLIRDGTLFGHQGVYSYHGNPVSYLVWTSEEEFANSGTFNDISNKLEKYYGEYSQEINDKDEIEYLWTDCPYDYDTIFCELKGDERKLIVGWVTHSSESEASESIEDGQTSNELDNTTYSKESTINNSEKEQSFLDNLKNNEFLYDGYMALMDLAKYEGADAYWVADNILGANKNGYKITFPGDFFGISGTYTLTANSWETIESYTFYPDNENELDAICDVITELYGDYTEDESDEKGSQYYWETNIHVCSFRVYDKVYADGSGSLNVAIYVNYFYDEVNPEFKFVNEDNDQEDFYSTSGRSTSISNENSSDLSASTSNTCVVSGCNKTGIYSVVGISGEIEYYCTDHYLELNAMEDSMKNSVGTTHTCAVSGCSETGTRSIIGLSGQREYYCETHYKEMQDTINSLIGD